MTPDASTLAFVAAVVASLAGETWWSRRNERSLRALGAREPDEDVYAWMQVAYPAGFAAMIGEGLAAAAGGAPLEGAALFVAAKALKYWAIATLGSRWCFRVLVPPRSAAIVSGPYRWIRHPNYVAVALEFVSVAVFVGAWRTGPVCVAVFSWLMWRRVRVEERALGYDGRNA